jgi:hypothetical protein
VTQLWQVLLKAAWRLPRHQLRQQAVAQPSAMPVASKQQEQQQQHQLQQGLVLRPPAATSLRRLVQGLSVQAATVSSCQVS